MKVKNGAGRKVGSTAMAGILMALDVAPFSDKRDGLTAYDIAGFIHYSPQHVNRCLKKMWADGRVGYRVEKSRNGEKRLWKKACEARLDKRYCLPFIQEELL